MLKKIIPAVLLLTLFSCGGDKDVHIYWVNSYTVPCEGVGLAQCLQFQKVEDMLHGEWMNMSSRIVGFNYEPGYLYKLKVKETALENPAADGSSILYELISIESKEDDPLMSLNSIWEAEKINGETFEVARGNEIPRIEVNIRANQLMGTDGCNFFHGSFKSLTDQNISLNPMAQTQKACPELSYPDAFMQAVINMDSYELSTNEQVLHIIKGDKVLAEFKRVQ